MCRECKEMEEGQITSGGRHSQLRPSISFELGITHVENTSPVHIHAGLVLRMSHVKWREFKQQLDQCPFLALLGKAAA